MISVNIVCIGRLKEDFYRAAVAEYAKRLSRFCKFNVTELAEGKNLEEEGKNILKRLKGSVVALCVEGDKMSSESFAAYVRSLCDRGESVTFVIGSSEGLAPSVKSAARVRLSFSEMTFPHQLMRVVLCEQIYRAFMINGGGEYHK